ncbi:MAG: DinB family protein [Dehalococcoidia bacterium]
MFDIATFRRLFEFERWANGRQLESLETTSEVSGHALRVLGHIYASTDFWVARLSEESSTLTGWEVRPLADLRLLAAQVDRRLRALLSRLDDAALGADVRGRSSADEGPRPVTAGDVLLHILLHSSQHRGQLTDEIGRIGGKPAVTDYDDWWDVPADNPAESGESPI